MSTSQKLWHVVASAAILLLGYWYWLDSSRTSGDQNDYPSRPVQIVVPYAAGGGSDTFVRIVEKGIARQNLLAQPLVIINQAGGIGTIGSREVKNSDPDGYKILCHHNAIITAKLAGTVPYGPEAFEAIALTGEMSMVILVRGDAPYQNIMDLLQQAKASPKKIRFGANKGAPAYFTALQLETSLPGAEFSVVSSGGGADRYSKVIGGHLEAGIFSLSEYLDFRGVEGTPPEEDIRAIAVLSEQRHESIPEVPTAMELGIPVLLNTANYWWAPKGTPDDILQELAEVLEAAMNDSEVRQELSRLRMDPAFDSGTSLQQRLDRTIAGFEAVSGEKPANLPAFPLYVGSITLLLLGLVCLESFRTRHQPAESSNDHQTASFERQPITALACLGALALYVVSLGLGILPFALSSTLMVMVIGGLMMRHARASRWVLLELALLTGFGSQLLFTRVFETILP